MANITEHESLVGATVDGYYINQLLGVGGMARVYRAFDIKLKRYVALKVIAPGFRDNNEYRLRFEREAQSIARLQHPNIVQIYRFDEVDNLYYMAMQFVEGVNVARLITNYKANREYMPMSDVLAVIQQIGAALDYAHSKGVIHRDVNPSNIILDVNGQAILTDFGLALLAEIGTQGEVFGSPYYISPEQAMSSGNATPQSDIYSLGVALFEMLTNEVPFPGSDSLEIANRHVSAVPPSPSTFNPAISPELAAVVLKCLEKVPSARFETGAELSDALQDAMRASGVSPTPIGSLVNRLSQFFAPAQVEDMMATSRLPAQTDIPPDRPSILPEEPDELPVPMAAERVSPPQAELTAPHTAISDSTRPVGTYPQYSRPATPIVPVRRDWRLTMFIIGGLLFLVLACLVAMGAGLSLVMASRMAIVPTLTLIPTVNAAPPTGNVAASPTSAENPTAEPTMIPTFTPVSLPAQPPTAPSHAAPPADRYTVPPGAQRLGEFTVEQYCNDKGYGVTLVNDQKDWACTSGSHNSVAFVLQPTDFDNICQTRYNNPAAFAIRDQNKPVLAYDWSCYF